jgi:hypothetical protein
MSENKARGAFPIAVFIDTNILDSLPEDLRSGDLSGLVDVAEKTGARIYIPDVVAREWLKHMLDRFSNRFTEYRISRDYLEKYLPTIPKLEITENDFLNSVYRPLIVRLRRSGCRILGPAKVAIKELTKHAVWEEPPFKKGNKGFKDELVVVTMLKLVRGWNYQTYVLVTKDADFQVESLRERFRRRDVVFEKVQSLHEAKELLVKKSVEEWSKAWKEGQAKIEGEIRAFLSPYWSTISEAVTRKFTEEGISTWTIYGYGQKDVPEHASIKRIVRISPAKIGTIDVGKEDERTQETPVTIGVEATLTLEIEESPFLLAAFRETIGPEGRRSPRTPIRVQARELDIVREVHCNAVVKRDVAGSLCELRLVDVRPDYRTLIEGFREKSTPSS